MRRMTVTAAVQHGRQFVHPHDEAGFLQHFPGNVLARRKVHVGPAPGQRPAALVNHFPHQQDAAIAKRRAADIDLRRRIALLGGEQRLDARRLATAMRRHRTRRERAQRVVTLAIIGVLGKLQPDLRDRLHLPRPLQPVRFRHSPSSSTWPC